MHSPTDLDTLSPSKLRELVVSLQAQITDQQGAIRQQDTVIKQRDTQIQRRDATIQAHEIREQKLIHEIALLRRHRFGRKRESLSHHQHSLLEELVDEDIAALEVELEASQALSQSSKPKSSPPKRQKLPPHLPRTEIRHEPETTYCGCGCEMKRIGEDISEKLDYEPGKFSVERHIRGKWACRSCETIKQVPVSPHIIDKGIATTNLLAQILIAKYADHQPLYRQQQIYARAGVELSRSTLSDWVGRCGQELSPLVDRLRDILKQEPILHADETPVSMLAPGQKKTHRAYVWAYASTRLSPIQSVVYDFQPTRSGQVSRQFLEGWRGQLVCDDFGGYKASFKQGITEIGCWAHARRKFYELHQSPIGAKAIQTIGLLYEIEREAATMDTQARLHLRQTRAKPILDKLRNWLMGQRDLVTRGTATAKAIDYSLKRWEALIRYVDDGAIPIDNNWVENQIRPWALGRSNWLFAGSLRSGQRAANIMTLIQSAKINGLDPQAYLKDVMERIPVIKTTQIDDLLPHNWKPNITQ